jgi:hypothetical protein
VKPLGAGATDLCVGADGREPTNGSLCPSKSSSCIEIGGFSPGDGILPACCVERTGRPVARGTGEPTTADLRQFMSAAAQTTRPRGPIALLAPPRKGEPLWAIQKDGT